ncbi:uncharacterized protein DUF4426 [Sinobacterium caligoides]|uniref:Uncharacterized protein DUF4426 n=1 Tax=Sinobacterium caligoides TaxID=933926 RepID=A0A3N2DHR6_9GAMM|nr:DUF4426 domain-containing protein [Sinobacterium caligoides]ROR98934.1 uncharacterized protein DUF4426 [Sinobacterium caligoides]
MRKLIVQPIKLSLIVMLSLFSTYSIADDFKSQSNIDNIEINYVLFPSTMIAPATAKALQLTRSENIQFVNVSVRERVSDSAATVAKAATISGNYFDLIHHRPLNFVKVEEQGAIYYLAPVRFPGEESKMSFELDVKYADNKPAAKIQFDRTLYRDIKK